MSPTSEDRSGALDPLTVHRLLTDAVCLIEADDLAATIGVPAHQLALWVAENPLLTPLQKTAVVFAVLTLAPRDGELFRAAATMRSQLAAARDGPAKRLDV